MQIILANLKKITVKEITEEYFDTKVYNNSGILDSKIKGFIRFTAGKDIILHQIYVHSDHRKEGVGSTMIEVLKKQKKKIITFSNTNDTEIFGIFLISQGFKYTENKRWEL